MEPLRSVTDLYKRAGGTLYLAAALGVAQNTVSRWLSTGIPVKYWDAIIEKFDTNVENLHTISKKARKTH